MSNQNEIKSICPYLGLANDQASRFSYPEASHFCFADNQKREISLDHQSNFCLNKDHVSCSRYIELSPELEAAVSAQAKTKSQSKISSTLIWVVLGVLVSLSTIAIVIYFSYQAGDQTPAITDVGQTTSTPTTTPTTRPTVTQINETSSNANGTSAASKFLATPTPTTTPLPGSETMILSPSSSDIGWVTSEQDRGNNFGDSYLYAGIFDGQIYNGAFQFDLSAVPRGAPIYGAILELTGLDDDRLSVNRDQSNAAGGWAVRLLAPEIDESWRQNDYQTIFNASAMQVLTPILSEKDLGPEKVNSFKLSPEQIEIIITRLIDNEIPTISFRIDGPIVGPDNLFAWDTGYGPNTLGNKVRLILEVGEPPATPPPYKYVLVTSTPTPDNVVTAAAIAIQQTAEATRIGTPTPLPPNIVTATPYPSYLVIVPTSTPENIATSQAQAQIATAEIILYGTPTPISTNAVTATPTPTETPTPIPVPIQYIIITDTPTPSSVFAAATLAAQATTLSQQFGTPTPLPKDWATPIVVTSTPTPINAATVQAINDESTAIAFTTGTPTSTPNNVVTATPTPIYEAISLTVTPTDIPPTVIPNAIPPELVGKVLFKSNREEGPDDTKVKVYVYDPETGELGRLTDTWPYDVAKARDSWSADIRYRAFTKDAIRYSSKGNDGESVRTDAPAIYAYDYLYNEEQQLTRFGKGIAYDGAWSPTKEMIAFVSNDSSDDEIWVVDYLSGELKQLTGSNEEYNGREIGKDTFIPEINKHPSWSPDGTQIVFVSTRSGNYQLWVMNADGTDQQLLMGWDDWTPYNDWDPVWVKYPDSPPSLN